jgi:hypothetical protein
LTIDNGKFEKFNFSSDTFRAIKSEMREQIISRHDPDDRWEHWECMENECFNDNKLKSLLTMRNGKFPKYHSLDLQNRKKFDRYVDLFKKNELGLEKNERDEFLELFGWTVDNDLIGADHPDF